MLAHLVLPVVNVYAQTTAAEINACKDTGIVFAFFNGVQTTEKQAWDVNNKLKRIYGEKTTKNENIRYEVMYNQSKGFEDFVETFEQRLLEQERLLEGKYELFFEALKGDGPWWNKIINRVSTAKDILTSFVNAYSASVIRNLSTLFASVPPTSVNYAEHRTRIDNWALEGKKMLFVAHSQGNLFVNAAYNHAITKVKPESVKVVHIAPASPILSGNHTLADLDLVINGLRQFGNVASITDNIDGYAFRPAGLNGQKDALGHGLLEIYLNPSLSTANRIKSHIEAAFNSLVAPEAKAQSGFFTTTLTWNGSGDVDLHTIEPNQLRVWYANKTGASGYLDVDNIRADGPEHYYASCDVNKLQIGTYKIAVANFARAEGKTATVQVASWNDGVLGTKSVTLGPATGDNANYDLFNVKISKNATTGKYSASLLP